MRTTRKRLAIVLAINLVALLALAFSLGRNLGWIDKFWGSSNTTQTDSRSGGGGAGTATLVAPDVTTPLPWEFTFDNRSDPPSEWLGAQVGYAVRPAGDGSVLVKAPGATETDFCLFGGFSLSDYTIQADVQCELTDGELADVGVIAQGYILEMLGASQKLVIRDWAPPGETEGTASDFAWEGERWYVMKLQASVVDGNALLRAKVWPRGESEPETWTMEESVEPPNQRGCPGLFGRNSAGEILFDNVKVTAN